MSSAAYFRERLKQQIEDRKDRICTVDGCWERVYNLSSRCHRHHDYHQRHGTDKPLINARHICPLRTEAHKIITQLRKVEPELDDALTKLTTYVRLCRKSGDRYKLRGADNAELVMGLTGLNRKFTPALMVAGFVAPLVAEKIATHLGMPRLYPTLSSYRRTSALLAVHRFVGIDLNVGVALHIYDMIRRKVYRYHDLIAQLTFMRWQELQKSKNKQTRARAIMVGNAILDFSTKPHKRKRI